MAEIIKYAQMALFADEKPDPLGYFYNGKYAPSPITKDLPLMDLRVALAIAAGYLVVTWLLMKFMENRKPYDLYGLRLIHNIILVVVSLGLCVGIVKEAWDRNYTLFCNTMSANPKNDVPMSMLIYIFYVSKVYEFMDTFIMALRKKNAQISFLHVYHHATIFLIWWMNVYYYPAGDAYFAPAFNTFIHVMMYSYYLLATFNIPCPWKSLITKFQLLQFVSFVVQGYTELTSDKCVKLDIYEMSLFNTIYAFSLFLLFADFYVRTYILKPHQPRTTGAAPKKGGANKKNKAQ